MSPLVLCLGLLGVVCVTTWAVTARTGSAMWLDRLWSIMPPMYAWIFAAVAGFGDVRLNILAVLATLWGTRLTFSYARKGGYGRGVEDYRWSIIRRGMPPAAWWVFHALFVSVYQQVLLLFIVLPAWTAFEHPQPLTIVDWVLVIAFLVLLVGEGVADGQQWRFQQQKKARVSSGGSLGDGFVSTGLFAFSRHPHFLCELLMWWVFYAIAAVTTGQALSWTILGTVLLTAQIVGSTWMMESLSRAKYPTYAAYQAATSRLLPWRPRAG